MKRLIELFAYDQSIVTDELVQMRYQASADPTVRDAFAAMFPEPRQNGVDDLALSAEELEALAHPILLAHGYHDRIVPLRSTSLPLMDVLQDAQLHAFGITINPEWYQSVNPLCVVLFAPLFGWFFTRRAGRFPSTPVKFATAVLVMQSHDDVLADAIDDLDMLTTTAARTISLNPGDERDPTAVLAALLPARSRPPARSAAPRTPGSPPRARG